MLRRLILISGPMLLLSTFVYLLSIEKDTGKRYYEIDPPLVHDVKVLEYVDKIGKKLILASSAQPKLFEPKLRFYVMNTKDGDAVSMTTANKIYLDRNDIETAPSEGQVAGILAHEIAHNYLGHTLQTSAYGWCRELSKKCWERYHEIGRQGELEADALAVKIMVTAGYDPEDLAQLFLRNASQMTKVGQVSYPTHPSMYERVRKIRQLAKSLNVSEKPIRNTNGLKQIKKRLNKIKPQEISMRFLFLSLLSLTNVHTSSRFYNPSSYVLRHFFVSLEFHDRRCLTLSHTTKLSSVTKHFG